MKNIFLVLTLTAGSAFAQQAPPPASASAQVDARFAPWIGCWRLEDDLAGTGARMCITPDQNGVRLQTIAGTNRGIDELVIPDGIAHPISDRECQGTELAEWSKDGIRVFRSTNVTCGKETPRIIKSVAFLAPGPSWVSVQEIIGASATTNVRVQRYRRSANQQLADGTMAPQPRNGLLAERATAESTLWDVDDVIEASGKIPTEALQAALSELHHGFTLNKKALIALDDAGVHDQVIDLMVALSYPKRFVVERVAGSGTTAGLSSGSGWFDPFMTGMMTTPYADCYAPYGYGYRSYYSMCGNGYGYAMYGYPYYNYGYGYGYPNGGWIAVNPVPPIAGVPPATSAGEGRMVNGLGYTQIHNRDAEPAPRASNGGNGTASGHSSGGMSSGGYSSGSSSAGSSGSSGGSSGGNSGARVAVPKGGGGN